MSIYAFDAKRLFQNFTGLGNYSRTLVANLAQAYPQHQYALYAPKIVDHQLTRPFSSHPDLYPVVTPNGFEPKWYWRSKGMVRHLKELKPKVFHGLSNELPHGLSGTGIGRLVTIHDLIFLKYPDTFPWLDRQVYALKWRYSIQSADRVVAISESTANDIAERYRVPPQKIATVYQSCQAAYYEPLPDKIQLDKFRVQHKLPKEYFISVGSLIPRKNLLGTVEALAAMPSDQRPFLIVVGNGAAYKQQVEEKIRVLGIKDNVRFWDQATIETESLRMLYANALALVYPSWYEGFGLPVAESLLCGTPVITSNTSSLPEAAGPGGLIVNPHDTESIKDGMLKLVNDSEICRRLSKEGNAYVRARFSPQATASAMMQLYEEF